MASKSIFATVTGRNPNSNDRNTTTSDSNATKDFPANLFSSIAVTSYPNHSAGNASRSSLAPVSLASLTLSVNRNLMTASVSANFHPNRLANLRMPLKPTFTVYTATFYCNRYLTNLHNTASPTSQGTISSSKHQSKKPLKLEKYVLKVVCVENLSIFSHTNSMVSSSKSD